MRACETSNKTQSVLLGGRGGPLNTNLRVDVVFNNVIVVLTSNKFYLSRWVGGADKAILDAYKYRSGSVERNMFI